MKISSSDFEKGVKGWSVDTDTGSFNLNAGSLGQSDKPGSLSFAYDPVTREYTLHVDGVLRVQGALAPAQ